MTDTSTNGTLLTNGFDGGTWVGTAGDRLVVAFDGGELVYWAGNVDPTEGRRPDAPKNRAERRAHAAIQRRARKRDLAERQWLAGPLSWRRKD